MWKKITPIKYDISSGTRIFQVLSFDTTGSYYCNLVIPEKLNDDTFLQMKHDALCKVESHIETDLSSFTGSSFEHARIVMDLIRDLNMEDLI